MNLLGRNSQDKKRLVLNNRTWEAFGFGTQYAWLLAVAFCGALTENADPEFTLLTRISIPCALAMCNAGIYVLRNKLHFKPHCREAVVIMGFVQTIGTLVMAIAPLLGDARTPVAALGCLAASAGFSLHMIYGNVFWANIRSERVMLHMSASATCAVVVVVIILLLPFIARIAALCTLPLIGGAILSRSKRTDARAKTFRRVNPLVKGMAPRVLTFVSSYGFCAGLLLGLSSVRSAPELQTAMLIGAFAAGLLSLFFALRFAPATMLRSLFGTGVPAMMAGCSFIIADTRELIPLGGTIGCALLMGGFVACDLFMWFLNAEMVARTDKSPAEVLARSCACEWTFMTCGALLSALLDMEGRPEIVLAFQGALCLLIIVFAFVFTAHQAGMLADARVKDEESPTGRACAVLAERHGLSQREGEVLILLAAGRSVPYIQDELVISQNTVKTHTRSIYRKVGVSNKQELIDLVVQTGEA